MATRFNNEGEGEDWQEALWLGRVRKVMNGRPALASFRELEVALLALPTARLVAGAICDGADVCAVGAFALYKLVQGGMQPELALESLQYRYGDGTDWETAELGQRYGMTLTLAWIIGEANDDAFALETPEERYIAVLDWTRQHIARLAAKVGA